MSDEWNDDGPNDEGPLEIDALSLSENAAYIRVVRRDELENAPANAPETLYALHDENGRPLAVFGDRAAAVVAAKANNFRAMSVH